MNFPKDPPVIDREFLAWLKMQIGRCEWPRGCPRGSVDGSGLHAAHIRAKGHGGGRRKDAPGNIAVLCPLHHHEFDVKMGQNHANREWLRDAVMGSRLPYEQRIIREEWTRRHPDLDLDGRAVA